MMTNSNVEKIGNVLGNLIQVDQISSFGITLKRFIRVQVEINVDKPLLEAFLYLVQVDPQSGSSSNMRDYQNFTTIVVI